MAEFREVPSTHVRVRNAFRVAGPTVFLLGVTLAIISAASLFASAGSFEGPRYFWLGFVGLPLMFVGAVLSGYGYMGAVTAYTARELTGSLASPRGPVMACPRCHTPNPTDARFCKTCGTALA